MSAFVQTVVGSDSPPIGAIMEFGGNVEPPGWLFCFGQEIPRTGIYAQLFAVVGTIHGVGNGVSTFNVPDIRGRVVAGRDDMGGTAANRLQTAWGVNGVVLGANGGSQSHQLTIAQMPAHTHSIVAIQATGGVGSGAAYGANSTTGSTGGDQAHPNVQPTYIANKIIKYSFSGTVLPIVPGDGDVAGPASSVDGDLAVFQGTSGKFVTGSSRSGSVVQTIYGEYTASANLTTGIPLDDTIPQNTEGTQIISLSITPRFVNSKIVLRFTGMMSASIASVIVTAAVFRDSIASAIATTASYAAAANLVYPITLLAGDFPATVSTVTYAVRTGPHVASTVRFNGTSAARYFGGNIGCNAGSSGDQAMSVFSAYLNIAGLTDIGYRFYDNTEAGIGSRTTTGVSDAGLGWYSVNVAMPSNAVEIRWDSAANSTTLCAREYFEDVMNVINPVTLTSAYDAAKLAAPVGAAMTLTTGERNAIADALLVRTDGIETGVTLKQALRYVLAFCTGKSAGAGTSTIIFRAPDGSTSRVTLTVNTTTGERSAIVLNG